jgi:uncharacterized membrane protein YdjX (TVP38/TMEM64 family)
VTLPGLDPARARLFLHNWVADLHVFMASNWLAFALGQILVAASGVLPASMIAMMAGAGLGFGGGLALSTVATLLGGWIAFAVSRTMLGRPIARWLQRRPAMARIDAAMTAEGWRMVALLRVSPVMPFALTSYALGLTRIGQRDFLLGTLASLPALVGYVALGALGRHGLALAGNGGGPWHFALLAGGVVIVLYASLRVRQALATAIAGDGLLPE